MGYGLCKHLMKCSASHLNTHMHFFKMPDIETHFLVYSASIQTDLTKTLILKFAGCVSGKVTLLDSYYKILAHILKSAKI